MSYNFDGKSKHFIFFRNFEYFIGKRGFKSGEGWLGFIVSQNLWRHQRFSSLAPLMATVWKNLKFQFDKLMWYLVLIIWVWIWQRGKKVKWKWRKCFGSFFKMLNWNWAKIVISKFGLDLSLSKLITYIYYRLYFIHNVDKV